MTPFEVYRTYIAVKLHFSNSKYDYFRYKGEVKVTFENFEARTDQIFFRKIANHYDPLALLVSHLVQDPNVWIGDIAKNTKPYFQRRRVLDALVRHFELDIRGMDIKKSIAPYAYQHPLMLQKFLGDKISLETFVILCDLTGCIAKWKQVYVDDPAMMIVTRTEKYLPFLKLFSRGVYDREQFLTRVAV